jgi:hypothetical protein
VNYIIAEIGVSKRINDIFAKGNFYEIVDYSRISKRFYKRAFSVSNRKYAAAVTQMAQNNAVNVYLDTEKKTVLVELFTSQG